MTGSSPHFDSDSFLQTTIGEYLLRFGFGGAISVVAFYVGHRFGPELGGLLLAFPALLPASLTLEDEHEARSAAVMHARGAVPGAIGLSLFALVVVWVTAEHLAFALGAATLVWLVSSVALWRVTLASR
ncbi:MAG TPA: DUF3147 family protein [Polyangiaceae bacterium]|jgi:hypothetical protein|nr:DUF3147 family protein [Polyangiaceae bacterium]